MLAPYLDENVLDDISAEDDFTDKILKSEQLNRFRCELSILSKEYRECTVSYYADEIYDGAAVTNYGTDYDEIGLDAPLNGLNIHKYECSTFSGYTEINTQYAASFADFGVLRKKICIITLPARWT